MRVKGAAIIIVAAATLILSAARCGTGDNDGTIPGAAGQRGDETPADDYRGGSEKGESPGGQEFQ